MVFWRDIVFPIVLAVVAIGAIAFAIRFSFRFFGFDIPVIRFGIVVAIWHYVGPIMYNWLVAKIISIQYEGIEILYTPIYRIIETFEKLV